MLLSAMNTIITDILSKRQDLTQEHILSLIEEKKKEGRGLLSDEGAARLVAEELLIQSRGTELGRMQVKNLVSGLNDVSISGRVLLTWPPQQFQRRDGTPGRVMRLTLIDKSGRVRCALWDRHVDIASRAGVLQGRIVRIGHAYTRQGLTGEPEVHAGDRSSIEIDPAEIPTTDFPDFKDLFTQIRNLAENASNVNTVGIIDSEPRYHTFAKEDRSGSVLHAMLSDDSGTIPLVAWNEKAEELRELKRGNVLQVMNGRTKLDTTSRPELHVESRSQVSVLPSSPEFLKVPIPKKFRISELTGRLGLVDLTALVLMKSEPREVKRATTNENVKVSTIVVADDTGIASISLWDDNASLVSRVREGETVDLQGVLVRDAMGELRLNLAKTGTLQKAQVDMQIVPPVTKLSTMEASKGLLIVEGTVSDEPLIRQVVTAKGENVNVASFTIRDDTTSARVSIWRDQVDIAKRIHPGARLKITGARVRPGMGQLELSTIPVSKIELVEGPIKDKPAWEDIRHVIALEQGLSTWIKGVVQEVKDPLLSAVCETCHSDLTTQKEQFFCEKCGATKTGNLALSARLRVDDGTGVVELVLSNQDITDLTILDVERLRESALREGKSTWTPSPDELANLVGKELEVYGTAESSSGQGKFDFNAKRVAQSQKSNM